jgi:hypothetical protein
VKVLFDNCILHIYASPLDGFIRYSGHRALHISEIDEWPNGRHSKDLEWIEYLRNSPDTWIFMTADRRLSRNSAERAALWSARLHGFALAPSHQKTPMNQVAAALLWRWPEIETLTSLVAAPSMHEIPIGKSGKPRSILF